MRCRGEEEGINGGLAERVRISLRYLTAALDAPGAQFRFHNATLYNSIFRSDSSMLVNTHVYGSGAGSTIPFVGTHCCRDDARPEVCDARDMRSQVRKYATDTKFSADTFAEAIGGPLPAWLLNADRPGLGTLVAAEVAPDGWSAVLTIDIPQPH